MSLFSRLFRKAPSARPAATQPPSAADKADPALARPGAATRALQAAAEEIALQAAIDANDVQALARLVVTGASTKVRQAAAHAVEEPALLRQLIRDVRGGNDKTVYKILTAKRDAQQEQVRRTEQVQAEIEAAGRALERHSQTACDSGYAGMLEQLLTRWEAVTAAADATQREQVQQWVDRARQNLADHASQRAAEAAQAQAAIEAAAAQQQLREQAAQAAATATAEQAAIVAAQRQAEADQQAAEQQAHRQIAELIRKARGTVSGGSTARAAGLRREIEARLASTPPLPAALASQLLQLDQQLDALKDWKQFSVAPKRAELIQEMELLLDVSLDPLALAERIKSLQDEWQTLGKGAGEAHEADALRFREAAQKAYQPCKDYFAAQALIREENLQRREALITRLTAFAAAQDEAQPDWPAIIRTLRDLKQAWRGHTPVDPQAGRSQQERFSALIGNLQHRLDAEYARNVQQKESLIERASQWLASDDSRKAIDAIKALQQQWRTVGPVPREVDQTLWGTFRQHCDAVFQKRQQDFAAYTAALDGNKARALALCEQVEAVAALEGAELLARIGALGELRQAFEALGEFPRAASAELHSRFDQALKRCDAALARQQARDAERAWDALFKTGQQIQAHALARVREADAEQILALKTAAEADMARVTRWPPGARDALQQALAAAPSPDLLANETAARLLCIRAEILSDRPTPAADQALRRDYQLQRLVQGMGQRVKADEPPLDALAIEWVRLGPVEESAYAPLLERFRQCRERGSTRR